MRGYDTLVFSVLLESSKSIILVFLSYTTFSNKAPCFIALYILYVYYLHVLLYFILYYIIGVRAGARTGYVIPGRDGIGGLDPARNSSAVVVVVVAVRGEGEGGGGRDSKY